MYLPKPKTSKQKQEFASKLRAYQKEQEKKQEVLSAPLNIPDPNLPIAVIIDIDGTLSKRGSRGIYDFNKSIDDDVFHAVKYILQLIDDANRWQNSVIGKTHIIILTGREEQFKEVTNEWLNKHGIPFDLLFMRRTADRRDAAIVKEEIWAGNIRNRYNVLFVLDDTKRVIDMFRSHGIYSFFADNSRE